MTTTVIRHGRLPTSPSTALVNAQTHAHGALARGQLDDRAAIQLIQCLVRAHGSQA
jgi:hypothetical protein